MTVEQYIDSVSKRNHLLATGATRRRAKANTFTGKPVVENFITKNPIDGGNRVSKVWFEENYEITRDDSIVMMDQVDPM